MPYIDSKIPKSIFILLLLMNSIARSSLFYSDFNGKAMELLNRMKAQGAQSSGVEKHYPKSFEDMKKCLPILGKIVMKFFLNFIFKLES